MGSRHGKVFEKSRGCGGERVEGGKDSREEGGGVGLGREGDGGAI